MSECLQVVCPSCDEGEHVKEQKARRLMFEV